MQPFVKPSSNTHGDSLVPDLDAEESEAVRAQTKAANARVSEAMTKEAG